MPTKQFRGCKLIDLFKSLQTTKVYLEGKFIISLSSEHAPPLLHLHSLTLCPLYIQCLHQVII